MSAPSSNPLAGIVNLADHEIRGRARLDDNARAYFDGGAADEITLRANRAAWDAIGLLPRVLRPLAAFRARWLHSAPLGATHPLFGGRFAPIRQR